LSIGCFSRHFVGQRQAVRRHYQGDHHLRTIPPLVPAVQNSPRH
jgi:hypothetical protein